MALWELGVRRGNRAGQPAATAVAVGTLYYVTDENVTERSNGTTWDDYSDSGAGGFTAASQAEQETATSTTVGVTPGRQQFHPSANKCSGRVDVAAGTPSTVYSYNVTSITDTGVGRLTVTIATDLSSANYSITTCGVVHNSGTSLFIIGVNVNNPPAAGSFELNSVNGSFALADPDWYMWNVQGDQ